MFEGPRRIQIRFRIETKKEEKQNKKEENKIKTIECVERKLRVVRKRKQTKNKQTLKHTTWRWNKNIAKQKKIVWNMILLLTLFEILFVFMVECKVDELKEVYGVVSGSAHLPCNITSASPADSARLVLWYKDDSPQPVYSLDARFAFCKLKKIYF